MVTYTEWTQIAFNVAKARGFDPSQPSGSRTDAGGRSFSENNANAEAVQLIAEIWNDRKDEISGASRTQAREIAKQEIVIQ